MNELSLASFSPIILEIGFETLTNFFCQKFSATSEKRTKRGLFSCTFLFGKDAQELCVQHAHSYIASFDKHTTKRCSLVVKAPVVPLVPRAAVNS